VLEPVNQAPALTNPAVGRTLAWAGWILGLAALAEIAAGGAALVQRARRNPLLPSQLGSATETGARPQPLFSDPFASLAGATPAPKPPSLANPASTPRPVLASPLLPKPTPVEETQALPPESRLDGLVAEARALRARGDTSTAVTRLREALATSPKSVVVLSELAETYEKMGQPDKALEYWRAIFDIGPVAGVYYELADAKLKAAQIAQDAGPAASASPDNGGVPMADANGFQPGSSLALVNLAIVPKPPTAEGYKRFTLKIPVKRRPDARINVSSVVIQVFIYEQLGNQSIVRTNANVSSHWATLPADWKSEDIEILEVDYTQAPPEPGEIEKDRHYYGYIVCVYYDRALQDQAADPPDLTKKFPPPLTLPETDK